MGGSLPAQYKRLGDNNARKCTAADFSQVTTREVPRRAQEYSEIYSRTANAFSAQKVRYNPNNVQFFCATQTIIPSQSSCKAIPSTHSAADGNMRFPLATPSKGDAHSWDYSRAISDVNPKLAASFNRQPSQHARLKDVTNSRKSSFVIQP